MRELLAQLTAAGAVFVNDDGEDWCRMVTEHGSAAVLAEIRSLVGSGETARARAVGPRLAAKAEQIAAIQAQRENAEHLASEVERTRAQKAANAAANAAAAERLPAVLAALDDVPTGSLPPQIEARVKLLRAGKVSAVAVASVEEWLAKRDRRKRA